MSLEPYYQFPQQPDLEPIGYADDGHPLYRVRVNYIYQWTAPDGKERRLIVPYGFRCDGASVPKCLWHFMLPDGLHRAAALIHDFLYDYRGQIPVGSYQRLDAGKWVVIDAPWKRVHADKMFARILRESNVPKFQRRNAYRAVRIGGWTFWRS